MSEAHQLPVVQLNRKIGTTDLEFVDDIFVLDNSSIRSNLI